MTKRTRGQDSTWNPLSLRRVEVIRLSEQEGIAFAEMILNPPTATDALREAIADYLDFFSIRSMDDFRDKRQVDEKTE
jgi:hypothetical protein